MIPWNAGGAFVITALALGIREGELVNLLYIPFAFACWLSPLIGITYAATGKFSPRASDEERAEWGAPRRGNPRDVTPRVRGANTRRVKLALLMLSGVLFA